MKKILLLATLSLITFNANALDVKPYWTAALGVATPDHWEYVGLSHNAGAGIELAKYLRIEGNLEGSSFKKEKARTDMAFYGIGQLPLCDRVNVFAGYGYKHTYGTAGYYWKAKGGISVNVTPTHQAYIHFGQEIERKEDNRSEFMVGFRNFF